MRRNTAREMSLEEFDAWSKAYNRFQEVAEAADEAGGPSLSLVPEAEQAIAWPTDLLPPAASHPSHAFHETGDHVSGGMSVPEIAAGGDGADAAVPAVAATPFDGVALTDSRKRLAGWCVERQRHFLTNLAETGSVHLASAAARLSARGAYALRTRSASFAAAWDMAERLAAGRLAALAFDRAINGRTEQVYHQGNLVAEKRLPSDKLLMWLLARLDPARFAAPWERRKGDRADPQAEARTAFPELLDGLADIVST